MGFPAARVTDMTACPMMTPAVVPVPHVGGPIIPPCCPRVLTGKMPQARVGDISVCAAGGPATIITGAWNVLVGGSPAARITDKTNHGGMIATGFVTVLIGTSAGSGGGSPAAGVTTGLGSDVDDLVALSPSLSAKVDGLLQDGWTIEGRDGGGSATNRAEKTMYIDTSEGRSAEDQVRSLSHEAGHAAFDTGPAVPPDGLTREEYIEANTNQRVRGEGEATLSNIEARNEIAANGGPDIGISGNSDNHADYQRSYEDYQRTGDREAAREEIGGTFLDGETTSTTNESYRDFYERQYGAHYDRAQN